MKLGYKFWVVSLGIIFLWGVFLFTAPSEIRELVAILIAGWQVGVWSSKIGFYLNDDSH